MTPIHDWSRVDANWFRHFRLNWICSLTDMLNGGLLPEMDCALIASDLDGACGTTKASRIVIQRGLGKVSSVIDIVLPEIKQSATALNSYIKSAVEFLQAKTNLLIVDLFPATRVVPVSLHQLIWEQIENDPFQLPPDKPLTLASYSSGDCITAYIEPVAVGDVLPDMALFLTSDSHVPCPLAATYETTWNVCPKPLKNAVLAAGR